MKIHLYNDVDASTPSLQFKYIQEYVLTKGVERMSTDYLESCSKCRDNMGRNMGCEYTKRCGCLEYAAVDEARLTAAEKVAFDQAEATGSSTMGKLSYTYHRGIWILRYTTQRRYSSGKARS